MHAPAVGDIALRGGRGVERVVLDGMQDSWREEMGATVHWNGDLVHKAYGGMRDMGWAMWTDRLHHTFKGDL